MKKASEVLAYFDTYILDRRSVRGKVGSLFVCVVLPRGRVVLYSLLTKGLLGCAKKNTPITPAPINSSSRSFILRLSWPPTMSAGGQPVLRSKDNKMPLYSALPPAFLTLSR